MAFAMRQAIFAQVNPYPDCSTGVRVTCVGDDGLLNIPITRGNDGGTKEGPTESDRARMRQLNHDGYVSYHRTSLDYANFGSRLPSFSPGTVNFVVGFGNSVSFGAGGLISGWVNGEGSFDTSSQSYLVGSIAGVFSPGGFIKVGGSAAKASAYSVAFETKLSRSSYPGVSRAKHNQEGNQKLLDAMDKDPQFASMMNALGIDITRTSTGLAPRTAPSGWVWHHESGVGVLRLVPKQQHTIGSPFWDVLHPGGKGGYSIWGK